MGDRHIFAEIEQQLQTGHAVVQATVIQTKGSTPRKEGSTMLVRDDGTLFGTIGGGCGEAGVIQKARLSLKDGRIREELADLTEEISVNSEAVCGGTLRVFIEPWQPTPGNLALAGTLKSFAAGPGGLVVHQIVRDEAHPELVGRRYVVDGQGRFLTPVPPDTLKMPTPPDNRSHQLKQQGPCEVYSERWDPVQSLVIVGAGHIAEPLERFARECGFRTVVVDDRTLFANRERFPHADQVVCGPILEVVRQIALDPHTYVVLVTRGHTLDMDALKVLLQRGEPIAYTGMIGSTRRIRAVFQLLEEQGFARELFSHVRSPVGLNIGAETPAEIAIAVLAEMIAVKRGIDEETRPLVRVNGMHPSLRRASAS